MATKVFISWSGELSRKLGEALRRWLPASLQYVKPYFSPEDIEKGTKWNSEIAKELQESNVGVICLTQENTEKPWIIFEAGALSKTIDKSRVCTLLFNLEPSDVKGPLTSFQSTRFVPDDFKRLITTINAAAGDARLEPAVLESVFEMWWPKLQQEVASILQSHKKDGDVERRSERDILEEVLELTRLNAMRSSKTTRFGERALTELLEVLDELTFVIARRGPDEISAHLLQRVDRPLRHLCREAGVMQYYQKHRERTREFLAASTLGRPPNDPSESLWSIAPDEQKQ